MSGEQATPAATPESTPAPQPETAPPSPAAADGAAPASDADGELLADNKDSDAKASTEAKADDAKPAEAKADDDFLAEKDDDAEDKADAPGDAKPESAAEAYQPFTLPDGQTIDEATLAEATPLLRKLKIDQDGAQELVSFYAAKTQEAVQSYYQQLSEGHRNTLKSWTDELKALPEYKGKAFSEAKARVANVLNTLGTPALKQLLDKDYGVIRNPHVFKFLDAIGTKLSPDSLVREDAGAPEKAPPQRDADIFYS